MPRFEELVAPSHWRTVDFISDLHLQASEPATVAAWQRYLQTTPADAVFVLEALNPMVAQQVLQEGVLSLLKESLQGICVSGVASLGALGFGHAQLIKEHDL